MATEMNKAYDIEITFEDGTVFSIEDGEIVNVTDVPPASEEVKNFLAGERSYSITVEFTPHWSLAYLFPPGGIIPGLHDN